jgi:hypothetical protein
MLELYLFAWWWWTLHSLFWYHILDWHTTTILYICVYMRWASLCMCGIRCGFKPLGVSCGLGKLGEFRTPGRSKQTTTGFRVGDRRCPWTPPTDMRWGVWSGDTCDGCCSGPRGGDALLDLLLWMYRWNLCFVGICWRAHHLPYGKGSSHSLVRRYQLCGRSVLGLGLSFHEGVRSLAAFQPLFPRPSTPLFGQVRGSRSGGHSVIRMGPDMEYSLVPFC